VYDYFIFIQIAIREHGIREGRVIGFYYFHSLVLFSLGISYFLGCVGRDSIWWDCVYYTSFCRFIQHRLLGGVGWVGFSWLPCFVYRIEVVMLVVAPDSAGLTFVSI
jgi:hypothetical protein